MNRILLSLLIAQLMLACTPADVIEERTGESQVAGQSSDDFTEESGPERIVVQTYDQADNKRLFERFSQELERHMFAIEKTDFTEKHGGAYQNCTDNTTLVIKGEGIRWYYVKRQKAKPANYYPDFVMSVYELPTEAEAKALYEQINEAFHSGGRFCNGKAPLSVVYNGSEVFSFSTRAEMFRGYIHDFAALVEDFE